MKPLHESVWLVACGCMWISIASPPNSQLISRRPSKLEKSTAGAWGVARCKKGHGRIDDGVHHGTDQHDLLKLSPAREEDQEEPGD